MFIMQAHATDPTYHISDFGLTTSTSNLQKHLFTDHIAEWVASCESLHIPITAAIAIEAIHKFHKEPPTTSLESERPQYSKEAFTDAIVDFVVGDDQSINVIESPRLKKHFLLLRQELKESDIPGRTTIHKRIEQVYQDYLKQLEEEMTVCNQFILVVKILTRL
ncbi:hypothetical protein BYT27DRAFT_7219956 [Phlegmacium glaucopus]|nr:hypothetical protein BYT27DRAFT_7219956 [Phlegmacium glaucopus]